MRIRWTSLNGIPQGWAQWVVRYRGYCRYHFWRFQKRSIDASSSTVFLWTEMFTILPVVVPGGSRMDVKLNQMSPWSDENLNKRISVQFLSDKLVSIYTTSSNEERSMIHRNTRGDIHGMYCIYVKERPINTSPLFVAQRVRWTELVGGNTG